MDQTTEAGSICRVGGDWGVRGFLAAIGSVVDRVYDVLFHSTGEYR